MSEKAASKRHSYARLKAAAYAILGGYLCNRCKFTDWRALQIDHVGGGGTRELKTRGWARVGVYRDVLRNPTKYQVLCSNCNWIKRYENKELPYLVEETSKP